MDRLLARQCPTCDGEGYVVIREADPRTGGWLASVTCPTCHARGTVSAMDITRWEAAMLALVGAGVSRRTGLACVRLIAVGRSPHAFRIVPSAGVWGADLPSSRRMGCPIPLRDIRVRHVVA